MDGQGAGDDELNDDRNIWEDILEELKSQGKVSQSKTMLVLGDNETGKTSLISKLQGLDVTRRAAGLEYLYMSVKDENAEDLPRLGAWIMDGDPYHRALLRFALTEQSYPHTIVLLVASMCAPWNILESLQRWAEVLTTHVERLKISRQLRRKQEDKVRSYFQNYEEPDQAADPAITAAAQRRKSVAAGLLLKQLNGNKLHDNDDDDEDDDDDEQKPLGDNILTHNLGLPIVVIITKTDNMTPLEEDHEYKDSHFDFIQLHIRNFCLQSVDGAALIYTSVREKRNNQLLYDYLVHRVFEYPCLHSSNILDRDAIFIPAGWDNERKISILNDGLVNIKPTDPYNEVVFKPTAKRAAQRQADVEQLADEEQQFLIKLQNTINKYPALSPAAPAAGSAGSAAQRGVPGGSASPAIGASPGVNPLLASMVKAASVSRGPAVPTAAASPAGTAAAAAAKKADVAIKITSSPGDTGVLANFFSSLLSKRAAASSTPGPAAARPATRRPLSPSASRSDSMAAEEAADVNAATDTAAATIKSLQPSHGLTSYSSSPELSNTNNEEMLVQSGQLCHSSETIAVNKANSGDDVQAKLAETAAEAVESQDNIAENQTAAAETFNQSHETAGETAGMEADMTGTADAAADVAAAAAAEAAAAESSPTIEGKGKSVKFSMDELSNNNSADDDVPTVRDEIDNLC